MNLFKKNDTSSTNTPAKKSLKDSFKTNSFKIGGYSVILTAIVIAIVLVVNIVVNTLPTSITAIDTTSEELFTISGQTKELVSNLDSDVTLYFIAENGNEQTIIKELLDKYDELSNKITVRRVDPAVDPSFVTAYTDSSMTSNSVIVESSNRYRIIDYSEIILEEVDYSTYYTTGTASSTYSFAGESVITSAIDYVTSDNLPKIYNLTGHGEAVLSDKMQGYIASDNIELEDLSLVSAGEIPEDAYAILINAPSSDLSKSEADIIIDYLNDGGRLMLLTGFNYDTDTGNEITLANLSKITETYGCSIEKGIVCEEDTSHYLQTPTYLLPNINSHDITAPMLENGSYIISPISQGINISDNIRSSVKTTPLLTTSDSSYSECDVTSQTAQKDDADAPGPFDIAVAIEENYDDVNTKIVWISCPYILNDEMDEYVSGGNSDFFRNSLAWLTGREESISIRTKSLSSSALTVTQGSAYTLMIISIIVLPLGTIIAGLIIWLRRRKR